MWLIFLKRYRKDYLPLNKVYLNNKSIYYLWSVNNYS